MFVGYWVIYLFLHLIDKVSLQDPEKIGVVGGSVILPCLYLERELKPEKMNVFWRYNNSENVFDIVKGNPSTKEQLAIFSGRVESFPSEYAKGNFSLRLSKLELRDEGQFLCDILEVKKEHKLSLRVRVPTTTVSTTTASTPSSSMRAQAEGIVTFLLAVLEMFILHCICVFC